MCRFGSFAEVAAAPQHLLNKVPGVGEALAVDLEFIAAAVQGLARGQVTKRQILAR
jgi:DNA repair protein RadC